MLKLTMNDKNYPINASNEISFFELTQIIWKSKYIIILTTLLSAVFSVYYSINLPNIYTSKSILAPVSAEGSLSSKLGAYSGLAGLAGVNLTKESSKTQEGIERIKSFEFFSNHFLPYIQLENLLALKKWDYKENELVYDSSLFNSNTNKWIREAAYPKKIIPSNQEAFRTYKEIINISEARGSGFITLSIDHFSPYIAKKWVNIIINQINESMREIDIKNAQNSINFLNESSKSTNIQSIKEVISSLLENQMQTLMLASSNDEYVFKIIDSPIAPEIKTRPNRALICILGTILGGMLSILIVLIVNYKKFVRI